MTLALYRCSDNVNCSRMIAARILCSEKVKFKQPVCLCDRDTAVIGWDRIGFVLCCSCLFQPTSIHAQLRHDLIIDVRLMLCSKSRVLLDRIAVDFPNEPGVGFGSPHSLQTRSTIYALVSAKLYTPLNFIK
jgi:hypothetical protein